jgi:hypothetical protein
MCHLCQGRCQSKHNRGLILLSLLEMENSSTDLLILGNRGDDDETEEGDRLSSFVTFVILFSLF